MPIPVDPDKAWKVLKVIGEVAMAAGSIIAAVYKIIQCKEGPPPTA